MNLFHHVNVGDYVIINVPGSWVNGTMRVADIRPGDYGTQDVLVVCQTCIGMSRVWVESRFWVPAKPERTRAEELEIHLETITHGYQP